MRILLVLAGVLAGGAATVTAAAQHGGAAAPAAHASETPKPAQKTPDKKTAATASDKPTPAAGKGAPKSDLEAVLARIAQKIDGAEVMPGGLRISSGSTVPTERAAAARPTAPPVAAVRPTAPRAAEARPAEPRIAGGDAASRIHLIWRSAVVWPSTLEPVGAHDAGSEPDATHIALAWP